MRLKKSFTILLVICFLATLMLSLTFIAENSHHECTEHDCVICQMLETAEEITGGGKDTAKTAASRAYTPAFTDCGTVAEQGDIQTASSPVLLHDLLTI